MKKIIATVLAMVMALALCTTAFAATTTTELKAKDFSLLSKDNATTTELDKVTKTVQDPTSITDKDGKTTTTTLIAKVFEAAGRKVHLGGNIGHPLLAEAGRWLRRMQRCWSCLLSSC